MQEDDSGRKEVREELPDGYLLLQRIAKEARK
jgi:hypothetical protein